MHEHVFKLSKYYLYFILIVCCVVFIPIILKYFIVLYYAEPTLAVMTLRNNGMDLFISLNTMILLWVIGGHYLHVSFTLQIQ